MFELWLFVGLAASILAFSTDISPPLLIQTTELPISPSSCPLTGEKPRHPSSPLSFCGEHDNSCCSAKYDNKMFKKHKDLYIPLFEECPGCYEGLRRIFCGLHCSPLQSFYVETIEEPDYDYVFNVCPETCDALYSACKDTDAASRQHWSSSAEFCRGHIDPTSRIVMNVTDIAESDERKCLQLTDINNGIPETCEIPITTDQVNDHISSIVSEAQQSNSDSDDEETSSIRIAFLGIDFHTSDIWSWSLVIYCAVSAGLLAILPFVEIK